MTVEERRGEKDRKERVDRELIELLSELRVALPGVQVLFAFLLTVPFTQRFDVLDAVDRRVYFATVLLTATASAMFIAPAAHHRLRFRADVATKERLLHVANVLAILGSVALALAVGSVVYVIASVLYTGVVVRVSAAAVFTLTVLLWFALPFTLLASGEPVARSRR